MRSSRLRRGIALGAFAGSMFLTAQIPAAAIASSSAPPAAHIIQRRPAPAAQAHAAGPPAFDPHYFDQRNLAIQQQLANDQDWIVFLTALLFLAAIIQSIALIRSLNITRTAAMAAKRSAEVAESALTVLERPYVVIDMHATEPSLPWFLSYDVPHPGLPLHFQFSNHGRTPAILSEYCAQFLVFPPAQFPTPIDPISVRGSRLPGGIVVGAGDQLGQELPICAALLDQCANSVEQIEMIKNVSRGMSTVYFQGHLTYSDFFDNRHICGFCYAFMGSRWKIFGGREFNYSREDLRPELPAE